MPSNFWFLFGFCALSALVFIFFPRKDFDYAKIKQPTYTERPGSATKVPEKLLPTNDLQKVSYYDQSYCQKFGLDCITASGEKFDDTAFTCACSAFWALGSLLKITYQENSVVARCNDRGGFKKYGRVADLSKATFEKLAPLSKGVIEVKIEVL
jgi:rare lipoprotein A (peptidoglycan hydrolase)